MSKVQLNSPAGVGALDASDSSTLPQGIRGALTRAIKTTREPSTGDAVIGPVIHERKRYAPMSDTAWISTRFGPSETYYVDQVELPRDPYVMGTNWVADNHDMRLPVIPYAAINWPVAIRNMAGNFHAHTQIIRQFLALFNLGKYLGKERFKATVSGLAQAIFTGYAEQYVFLWKIVKHLVKTFDYHLAILALIVGIRKISVARKKQSLWMYLMVFKHLWRYFMMHLGFQTFFQNTTTFRELSSRFMETPIDIDKTMTIRQAGEDKQRYYASKASITAGIEKICDKFGRRPYYFQMSKNDQKANRVGSRMYYWPGDTDMEERAFAPTTGDVIIMQETDYYVDMNQFLLDIPYPVMMVTFQPEAAGRETSRYTYTFKNNVCVYTTPNGSVYTHKVWNYSKNDLCVQQTFLGFVIRRKTYKVLRRALGPDHELIYLHPVSSWYGRTPTRQVEEMEHSPLARLSMKQVNGFNRLRTMDGDVRQISTCKEGYYNATVTTFEVDETLAMLSRQASTALTFHTAQSYFDNNREHCAAIFEYHKTITDEAMPLVVPAPFGVRRYQFVDAFGKNYDPDARPLLSCFMSPLVHEAFAGDKTVENEKNAVRDRIESIAPPVIKMTAELDGAMASYLAFLIPESKRRKMAPVDEEEVWQRQFTSKQHRLLKQAQGDLPDRRNKAFPKTEPASKIAPQRIISQINDVDKLEYSQFTYAFEKLMKAQPWYGFARPPIEISHRVAAVCHRAQYVVASDFSRFDGRLSNMMRELELRALLRCFDMKYHDHLVDLHKSQYNLKGKLTMGTKFWGGYARCSGSPETSLFNSMVNSFVAFLTFLRQGYTPPQAWDALGIYGGDDGLTGDIDQKLYVKSAADLGMKLEAEPIQRGKLGVKFLARLYSPDVWHGDINSCSDIARQIKKLHVSANMPQDVTPRMKLIEKMFSLYMTDEWTPILGDLCRIARYHMNCTLPDQERTRAIRSWSALYPKDLQDRKSVV